MGEVIVRGLCKDYVERRRRPRVVNGAAARQGEALRVLDHVDLNVEDGQLVCVLGPSGCGKSTLLRILAGFERQTSGLVQIDGSSVRGPSADNIFVFQHSGLLPWMSVWDNVELGVRRLEDSEEREQRIQESIDLVELTGFERSYPHQLSGGMQRRAELARALVVNPEILFMDEPFSGLDFLTRLKLREEIINMHQLLQKTVLFITHDIDEAMIMGDHLLVLSERPSRIKLDVCLDFPHPRDFNRNQELADLRKELYRALEVHYAL
jgi:ABC-type nitrate/sulfonate/bicarbonate transport system ATPase subunit